MKRKHTSYRLLISSVPALGGLLFGYDWVVIGGVKLFYAPFLGLEQSADIRYAWRWMFWMETLPAARPAESRLKKTSHSIQLNTTEV